MGRLSSIELSKTGEFAVGGETHRANFSNNSGSRVDGFITRQLSVTKQTWDNVGMQLKGMEGVSVSFLDISLLEAPADFYSTVTCSRSVCCLPIINPFSKFYRFWSTFTLIFDLTYTAFMVPFILGFGIEIINLNWAFVIEVIAGGIFLLMMFFGFHTGFVISYNMQKRLIMDGKAIAWYYTYYGTFLIDLLGFIPVVIQLLFFFLHNKSTWASDVVSALRLLRFVRIYVIIRAAFKYTFNRGVFSVPFFFILQISVVWRYFISLIYSMLFLSNVTACILYYIAEREGLENSWLQEWADESIGTRYLTSVYFAVTTLSTVGYGDISPVTAFEEAFQCLVMYSGVMFFSFVISSLQEVIFLANRKTQETSAYLQKVSMVQGWIQARKLPHSLRKKIKRWYGQVWVRQGDVDTYEIFEELPSTLRARVAWQLTHDQIRTIDGFEDLPEDALKFLTRRLLPVKFEIGHDLFTAGEYADRVWLLLEGEISYFFQGYRLGRCTQPSLIGGLALIADEIPSAQIRQFSVMPTGFIKIWQIGSKELQRMIEYKPLLKRAFYEALVIEIERILRFEIQYTKTQHLEKQIKLFADARYVINRKLDLFSYQLDSKFSQFGSQIFFNECSNENNIDNNE